VRWVVRRLEPRESRPSPHPAGAEHVARVAVEEVDVLDVDGELDLAAGRDRRAAVDPCRELRPLVVREEGLVLGVRVGGGANGVCGDGRRVDVEDHVRLGAELLDDAGPNPHPRQGRIGGRAVLEVGRPNADQHAPLRHGELGRECESVAAEASLALRDHGLDEVHRRRADEGGDEEVGRRVEQVLRRVHLLEAAVADDRDTLAERHRLDLVVRDVDRRDAELLVQPRERRPHRNAELRVEVRQRLVHQERDGIAHHGPADRDALALPARERGRLAVEQLVEPECPRGFTHALPTLGLRRLAQLQAEREILLDGHVRVERVVLEDHRDVALLRPQLRHVLTADQDRALGCLLETGDQAQ
jgi:hypothetical protein